MASSIPSKIFIKVETPSEQQENLKNIKKSGRTLAVLQKTGATDKENLVGRQTPAFAKDQLIRKNIEAELIQTPESRRKIPTAPTASASSQTSPNPSTSKSTVTAADLTSESVGEHYWEVLAEKRRVALEESLIENQELHERIASLEDELNHSKSMLTEARNLVEVLTEMLEEKDSADETLVQVETQETEASATEETSSEEAK